MEQNHELYEVWMKNSIMTGKIVELHQQLKAFADLKKLAEQYRNEFKELMKKDKDTPR
ncbi:hypothetical protein [Sutcliffiella cohnii]|uniref:hypothetical protein n=1 Tax=Sutcliffiella cohnii TaxID=33932 RepID=UPI002E1C7178|nr:hypothetical protein [Sutcliffiella cohnii]